MSVQRSAPLTAAAHKSMPMLFYVTVVQFRRDGGAKTPCKWCSCNGIYTCSV
ncbi:MAG: hypothetical protein IKX20_00425 [Paludibacteraceae bacterium]|nr:hypothetical protein [Paludibacteraceae bacterium]